MDALRAGQGGFVIRDLCVFWLYSMVETRAVGIAYTRRREKIKGEERLGSRRFRGTGESEAKQDQNLVVVPCAQRRAILE